MSNKLPLVSVVTLSYKKLDNLFENISSVLKQDYSNIEFIIADDGTIDFPKEKVIEFINNNKSNRIKSVKYLFATQNRGTVENLSAAYGVASGEILMPLSADDVFFDNEVISKVVEKFNTTKCEALCVSRVVYTSNNEFNYFLPHICDINKIKKINTPSKQYYAMLTGRFYNMASGSVLYMKKTLYDELGGFDKRFYLWEDGPFLLKMFSNNHLLCTDYSIFGIKYGCDGLSSNNNNLLYEKDKELYGNVLMYEKYDCLPHRVKRFVNYNKKRKMCKSKIQLLLLILLNLDILLIKKYDKFREKIIISYDRKRHL